MKRSAPRRVRRTLRRNEPSPAEKKRARELCCERAHSRCEMPFPHPCPGYVPLETGQLAHLRGKRRFGWMESAEQRHLWSCAEGHRLQHCYGWSGVKPVPDK
jgi:hypothetical protein